MTSTVSDVVPLHHHDSGESPQHSGPPMVLIHGWTCDSLDWVFQVDAFEEHARVVTPDLRGHGHSPRPEHGYSTYELAADVAALMRELDLGPAVVVGHSLGGVIAAALSVHWPELVAGCVVVEPAYGMTAESMVFLRDAASRFGDRAGSELAAELVGATEPCTDQWLRTWHRRRLLAMPPAIMKQAFDGMYIDPQQISGQPQTDEFLAHRTTPTLAFHRFVEMAEWERTTFTHGHSRAISWEGGGHWLHQQRPDEFNELVRTWIAGLPVERPAADSEESATLANSTT